MKLVFSHPSFTAQHRTFLKHIASQNWVETWNENALQGIKYEVDYESNKHMINANLDSLNILYYIIMTSGSQFN